MLILPPTGGSFSGAARADFDSIERFDITTVSGADSITTADGDDRVSTGAGDDSISTVSGADLLDGGAGEDALAGGLGDDTYVAEAADAGIDTVGVVEAGRDGAGMPSASGNVLANDTDANLAIASLGEKLTVTGARAGTSGIFAAVSGATVIQGTYGTLTIVTGADDTLAGGESLQVTLGRASPTRLSCSATTAARSARRWRSPACPTPSAPPCRSSAASW